MISSCPTEVNFYAAGGSIPKTVMIFNLAGKLKRKPSGGERAWKASFAGRHI
jgi:hypothetical protein